MQLKKTNSIIKIERDFKSVRGSPNVQLLPNKWFLTNLLKSSKFFSQLLDNMSFEMARMRLMTSRLYAKSDNEKEFIKSIEADYRLAIKAYEKITGYNSLLERNKVISSSIKYRNPFTDILNYAQIELLKRCQNFKNQNNDMDTIIFSSINHLAAAMQTSG